MKKHLTYKIFLLIVVSSALFVFVGCDATNTDTQEATKTEEAMAEDTMKEETVDDDATHEEAMDEDKTKEDTMDSNEEKTFTKEELSKFDGQNGKPYYVAVDGVVYDVSDKALWDGGTHKGNTAGMDLSEAILESPHGKAKLETLPVVGKLVD